MNRIELTTEDKAEPYLCYIQAPVMGDNPVLVIVEQTGARAIRYPLSMLTVKRLVADGAHVVHAQAVRQ